MSGIAGMLRLDGAPVERATVARLTDAGAHRGLDGAGYWTDGPVGLGHRMLQATPESLAEKQPLADESGDVCLVLDGRLDNRAELRALLSATGRPLRNDTDAELVLRAYQGWGKRCPERLLGDFAFAIWDGHRRRLFAARDQIGVRPFHYHADGRAFRFASELHQLLRDPAVLTSPNPGMVGEYLSQEITDREETLHEGVYRLPPAHALAVDPTGRMIWRYWDPDCAPETRYADASEYAEHLGALLGEAVRCRLRAHGPVGAELSGGLDSSSVVALARSLIDAGQATVSDFTALSLTFPGLECDETSYIRDVVARSGVAWGEFAPVSAGLDFFAEQARRSRDFPEYPTCIMSDHLRASARARGMRVLLTGYGGDDWLSGTEYRYADLLRHLHLLALTRRLQRDYRIGMIDGRALSLFYYGVWPLMPQAARRVLKRLRPGDRTPAWVNRDFAERIGLAERLRRERVGASVGTFARGDLHRALTGGWHAHSMEMLDRSGARLGIEPRHPFHDRRIVEFALAIPEEEHRKGDLTKFTLRRAMRKVLPETVRERTSKADFGHIFAETLLAPGVTALFRSLATAETGWVDGDRARRMHEEMAAAYRSRKARYAEHVWHLWMILGVELWLRALGTVPVAAEEAMG